MEKTEYENKYKESDCEIKASWIGKLKKCKRDKNPTIAQWVRVHGSICFNKNILYAK